MSDQDSRVVEEQEYPAQIPLYLPVPEPPRRDPDGSRKKEELDDEKEGGVIVIDI